MTNAVFYVVYWSLVFGVSSWFVHETWPFGLLMIPLCVLNVYAHKRFAARLGQA